MIDRLVKNVASFVSGGLYRRSEVDGCIFEAPLERYKTSSLAGRANLDVFAVALAATTRRTVQELTCDLEIPEYLAAMKRADKERLANLAAFVAWRETIALLEEERAAAEDSDGESGDGNDWIRDAGLVETIMYPQNEEVQAAIADQMHVTSDQGAQGPTAHERTLGESVDRLLGLTALSSSVDSDRRAAAVAAVFAKDRRLLAQTIGGLAGGPRAQ
ncbi:MAG: hypothetical protein GIW99_02240 [Candidatus Eremiobacteraeota bacterium]|nr:hypothetical protein [Candidatus Eremiobacteraeota bacterium]MBC5826495.1 hypothetical protein [Candidatus Eremiobacteraeota bacterium]